MRAGMPNSTTVTKRADARPSRAAQWAFISKRPVALNRHKVLHRAGTRDPVRRASGLGQAADDRWRDPSLTQWQLPYEAMDDEQLAARVRAPGTNCVGGVGHLKRPTYPKSLVL